MKVLIIEDDDRIALPLKQDLEQQHDLVQLASDGESGLKLGLEVHFDLILLDLMLPGMDGMTVCQKLRQAGCKSAIIMLTARNKTANKIYACLCSRIAFYTQHQDSQPKNHITFRVHEPGKGD